MTGGMHRDGLCFFKHRERAMVRNEEPSRSCYGDQARADERASSNHVRKMPYGHRLFKSFVRHSCSKQRWQYFDD
jgi:hypothetical protein